ncbi:hypothetical protein FUAX_16810 [Fulvitalea axinellae]|uniref:Lipid/polyisoprenoid-binding YceI-like domain-containing protein n=1 Tax=Fulvitalea axinellae TaxID=1182444 RepID=A0AAU9CS37_9BACT|nr:hypothetical protein FUAX_16810 [Fulvitalea axinellae]
MKRTLFSLAIVGVALMSSCSAKKSTTKTEGKEQATVVEANVEDASAFLYEYDASATKINWTAYKTTDKVGVGGSFNKATVTGAVKSQDPKEVIRNVEFTIPVSGTNTKLAMRDEKIIKFFFGAMTDTENIVGKIVSLEDDGQAMVSLTLNGVSKDVKATYKVEGASVSLKSVLDLNEFSGQEAVNSLNKACEKLHAGKDGVTKLWPEVSIEVSTVLKSHAAS